MITIRMNFAEISFDNTKEYTIYYQNDNPSYELEEGDIIILTQSVKYYMEKVNVAYDWIEQILCYIDLHRNEENIFIDMNKLTEKSDGEFREFEGYLTKVELIKDSTNDSSN